MDALWRDDLVVAVDVSFYGRTLAAWFIDSTRGGRRVWITVAGWIKSMAAESASHGYADAAAGSACSARTNHDSSPGANPPRGVTTRELPAMRRSDSVA